MKSESRDLIVGVIKYGMVSANSIVCKLAIFWLLSRLLPVLHETALYILTLAILAVINFTLLRKWVFPESQHTDVKSSFARFITFSVLARLAEALLFYVVGIVLDSWLSYVRVVLVSFIFFIIKYFAFKMLLFRAAPQPAE